jgi:acetyl esterase/lipase
VYEQERCRLDLVLPEGARGFPVLVWFHGGSLNSQSKENLATRNLAAAFAAQGIAAATAWVLAHVGEHGGDPKRVFVAGHSAGGYLALMLATEAKWLKAHGAVPEQLKGYIPVSGQTFTHYTLRQERGIPDPEGTPILDHGAPCYHAHAKVPPILAICADGDHADRRLENQYLMALLQTKGHSAHRYLEIQDRNHISLITEIPKPQDPVLTAIARFVKAP